MHKSLKYILLGLWYNYISTGSSPFIVTLQVRLPFAPENKLK